MEQAHGVRAAADAGDQRIGQPAFGRQHLLARLAADDRLKIAHHHRIGMRAGDGADAVERVEPTLVTQSRSASFIASLSVFDPDSTGTTLAPSMCMRNTFGFLPLDVDRAHIDDAFEAEARAQRRGGDAVHAGAGLGDDALLAHALRQHDLAEHVVDLVRAGMVELLALEINLGAATRTAGGRLSTMRRQPLGEIKRRRPADIVREVAIHLLAERRIGLGVGVGLLQFEDQRHQRLGDKAAAINAEMPALVGPGAEGIRLLDGHAELATFAARRAAASRAARMKARIISESFSPGARSTPEETSTPPARVIRKASATLPASRPPESMNGMPGSRFSRSCQSNDLPRPPGRVASRGARASNSSDRRSRHSLATSARSLCLRPESLSSPAGRSAA